MRKRNLHPAAVGAGTERTGRKIQGFKSLVLNSFWFLAGFPQKSEYFIDVQRPGVIQFDKIILIVLRKESGC
ncbi:MAG TPA: hypothetical protein DD723_04645 [Candidatus Omnitrophica bacterium]|nr:MAG: hypothetical protein A2Z81_04145 [Omnitrophica WOR_2 bacterium GWA2_45_18]HBR14817.1 hypothetical protein [Candidatus Omnitrophota bacterium]